MKVASRAAFASLAALAVVLPFEGKAPLFALGPLGITTTELALYTALLLWGTSRLLGAAGTWTAAHGAVLACAAAALVSAAAATHERGAALKFALRGLSGAALFFAVADQASVPRRGRRLVLALLAGAMLSVLATVGEAFLPDLAAALLAFKPATFRFEGELRPSGTLAYPTIAAMYFEAALPLLLAMGAGLGRRWRVATGMALVLVLEAIVLTGSRAGVAVALVTLLGLAWTDARGTLGLRGWAGFGAASLVLVSAGTLALRPGMADRLGLRGDGAWYRAEFRPSVSSLVMGSGETTRLSLRLRNRGAVDWAAEGPAAVFVSYEWLDPGGVAVLEGPQLPLGQDVRFGEQAALVVPLRAPRRPGTYRVRWQLGREGVTWGGAAADADGEIAAEVAPGGAGSVEGTTAAPARRPVQEQLTRLELWRAGLGLWRERPLVGVGPDNFRRLYARTLGPHPLDERIRANSLYVETLADTGLLGFAALSALVAALFVVARRRWRAPEPDSRRLLLGAAAGLVAFLVHGAVDDFLAFTPTLGLFWLLAGLLCGTISDHTLARHREEG